MELRKEMTLNQITESFPAALQILSDLGFDTCCGGWEEIGAASDRKGIAWDKVTAALEPVLKGA